jgi:hypothetical protein
MAGCGVIRFPSPVTPATVLLPYQMGLNANNWKQCNQWKEIRAGQVLVMPVTIWGEVTSA